MEKNAGIILFRKNKEKREYLLLKYYYVVPFWGFAKGKIESNEKEQETAIREAWEETNLNKIKLIHGYKEKTSFIFTRKNQNVYKEVTWFLGEVFDDHDGHVSEEHQELKWFSYEEASKKIGFDDDRELLTKAEKILS